MLLANVFLTVAMFLNSINVINFNDKLYKNQLSVEKNDILSLRFEDNVLDLEKLAPKYFLNSEVIETRGKGLLSKSFEKNFEEFYSDLKMKTSFLDEEIDMLENNSQAFSSEYLFHRKNHISTEIISLFEKIDSMTLKEKRKLICYEYRNNDLNKYNGLIGFTIIYNDRENPFLLGTIVMPKYIGMLESFITSKSIEEYKSTYKILSENIYSEPLSYFDRYFLSTVGFK